MVCKCKDPHKEYFSPLEVFFCKACGHREALHGEKNSNDYYENTPQNSFFIASLEKTRRRQAREITRRFLAIAPDCSSWLDFGAGRGWFLEEWKISNKAGFDTSHISTNWLRERGFEMADISARDSLWPDWNSISFSPQGVSFLDVLEHFPQKEAYQVVSRLLTDLPKLKYLVIKVPVSEGILFTLSRFVRAIFPGPYLQLFQLGTFPPHYHYFSRTSLSMFCRDLGLEILDEFSDSDVDNIFHRIPRISRWRGGELFTKLLSLFEGDTHIVIAKVRR